MTGENWKSQTWWSLPVYTGDVSGVCSALYELGGMIVMHDPSGCNSTYNTHDEIRWTSMESLIFLSGLTQLDAITGNDRKLIDDIVSSAKEFHPAFVAIANSPVPWLIGTDFDAICRKVREITGIDTFHVETNAMHDYTKGAGCAFLQLARMLFAGRKERTVPESRDSSELSSEEVDRKDRSSGNRIPAAGRSGTKLRVNVLGMTPLDFTVRRDAAVLRQLLEGEGFEVVSVWALGDTLTHIRNSLCADVNLVVSSTGIDTARWMEETFRIPYIAGIPVGAFSGELFQALRQCARDHVSKAAYLPFLKDCRSHQDACGDASSAGCVAGEPVTMGSVAAARTLSDGMPWDLIPLTETVRGLIPDTVSCPAGERQIREVLGRYQQVMADPMLRYACRDDCRFEAFPHFAFSGRMYLDRIRPYFRADCV